MPPGTPLELDEARRIGRSYGLEVARVEPVPGGRVNSNYRLFAQDGASAFLRIYEQQEAPAVRAELRLVRALVSAGVPTAAPLQRLDDGGWLEQCVLKPVAAFAWVDGHFTCQAKVTAGLCHALGEALAHLHAATPYCAPLPPSRFEPPDLMKRLDFAARAAPELAEAADAIGGKLEVYAGKRTAEMPSGLIHGDLFRENVLWQDGALRSLVDFECAGQGRYAYDLMVSMLAWCFGHRFDMALVGALLRGYCRHRRLTAREIQGLRVEAALGCLRFATTRLVDFSLPTRPGDTPVRDFRRFLARLEALERGAGTELVALATDASAGLQRRP